MNLISKEEYKKFSSKEKETYIKSILEIDNLNFIGKIKRHPGNSFAFIQNFYLFSPFGNLESKYKLLKDESFIELKAYFADSLEFENGEWVTFELEINDKKDREIEKNNLFAAKNVISFDSNEITFSDELFEELSDNLFLFIKKEIGPPEILGELEQLIKEKSSTLKNQISNKLEEELETLKIKVENLGKLEEEKQHKLDNLEQNINDKQQKLEELETNYKVLKKYQLIDFEDNAEENTSQLPLDSLENLGYLNCLEKIRQQLAIRKLFFDIDILRQVVTSLFINELLIMIGPSGTGKTSLIANLAEVIDAEITIIPVQPSWHDKQDLLGFYNPLSKLFISTPFIDTLRRAEKNPDKLFIINLDEINLSKVEYYLAEILSVRELHNPRLTLYSKQEYEKNIQEVNLVKDYLSNSGAENYSEFIGKEFSLQEYAEYKSRWNNIKEFPFSIPIPDNVRIVGTMNVEGLVEPLSPKVIDRAMIVPIEKVPISFQSTEDKKTLHLNKSWWQDNTSNYILNSPIINGEQLEDLSKLGLQINSRIQLHKNKYYNKLSQVIENGKELDISFHNKIVDDLLIMKYLPKIHHMHNDNNINLLFNHLDDIIKESVYPRAFNKYKQMKERSVESKIVSFWS